MVHNVHVPWLETCTLVFYPSQTDSGNRTRTLKGEDDGRIDPPPSPPTDRLSDMANVLPVVPRARLIVQTPVRFRRARAPQASLRTPSPPSAAVDWVKATNAEFFQSDSRPIMLFDGNTDTRLPISSLPIESLL